MILILLDWEKNQKKIDKMIYPRLIEILERMNMPIKLRKIYAGISSDLKFYIIHKKKIFHFEWSPPWHHIETYLLQILIFFVLKFGEDAKERIILMKFRALRSLDFIRIILSSSSLLLVRGPAMTTVIY